MVSANNVGIARRMQFFKGLAAEDVAKILSRGKTLTIKKGEILFYQDTTGNSMFVILAGLINLYDGKKRIASLKSGEMLGEMAIINRQPRSATAMAAEDSELFELTEQTFERLMTKRAAMRILMNIVETLSQRLKTDNAQIARLKEQLDVYKTAAKPTDTR